MTHFERGARGAALCLLLAFASPAALAQFVSLTGGTPATQNFDTLASSGTGTAVPNGWYFAEAGNNANASYAADDGSANAGNTYGYGAAGSGERAFGLLRSGSLVPTIGARLRNESAAAISEIAVAYTGEQWRLGASGRADTLHVQYSIDATSLDDAAATWVDVAALDFSSPVTSGAVGKLDGNAAANRRAISGSITGLDLAPAASLWIRWIDIDVSGPDDGLAIDDASFAIAGDPPVDVPPTVVSTMPADGAGNVAVASDVRVTFSEAVTTTDAFTLACDAEAIALDETGAGANRTLTPATVLPAGGTCTFTVIADGVRNGADIAMAADVVVTFRIASGGVDDYYAQVNASSPEQLRCSLHQTIKGHTIYPYSGAGTNTWTILEIAQQDPNDASHIIDIYRNHSYRTVTDRAGNGGADKYNREHTWPNSLGFANSNLAAYTDTHMLWLSDELQNSRRGNKPLDNCHSGCTELPTDVNDGVGGPGQSNWYKAPDGNAGSFEAWDHRKGEIARAMFYMAIRYEGIAAEAAHDGVIPDLELTDDRSKIVVTPNTAAKAYMGLLSTLLEWNVQDPPDAEEVARNEVIQSFQGNRNPFVDHPEWATRALFESSEPATCELNPPAATDSIFGNGFDAAAR